MNSNQTKRVAIIGAGVAGLTTAKTLLKEGYECSLFERNSLLGGVWSDGYLNFGAQVQRELYEFPDWPLSADTPDFTPGPILLEYLSQYADHFGITPHIRFNSRVTRLVEPDTTDEFWTVNWIDGDVNKQETFDLIVICTGLYSSQPNIPEFRGREKFAGEVYHNSLLKTAGQLKDKKVAIIGYGKSASDAALESSKVAAQTRIIFRQVHWPVPQKLAGLIPFKWGLLNRLCSSLIPPYQETTAVERAVHSIGKPLAWFYWRIVETLFYFQCQLGSRFGTRVSLVSKLPIEIDAFGESTQIPKPEFFRLARNGKINLHHAGIDCFTADGLQLNNGETLELDTVILATGWKSDFSYLPADTWKQLDPGDDGFYLYRHILNPNVKGLFFIGRAATISSILTYSLQARWLADVLSGKIKLPAVETMNQNIQEMKAWKQSWMPFSRARSARLIAHTQHYHDELVKDMGQNPLRKTGFFAPLKELIFAYEPRDYAAIVSARTTENESVTRAAT